MNKPKEQLNPPTMHVRFTYTRADLVAAALKTIGTRIKPKQLLYPEEVLETLRQHFHRFGQNDHNLIADKVLDSWDVVGAPKLHMHRQQRAEEFIKQWWPNLR